MTPKPPIQLAILLAATVLLSTYLVAETHYVTVDDSGFSPSVLNINVGDTVVWVNNDEFFPHTTTSDLDFLDPDYWHYLFSDYEEEFPKTFNNPGTFTYYDQSEDNTGTIIVNAVSTPEISLESPRVESGLFLFDVTGLTVGKTNVVEVSTNLLQWIPASTNVATASSLTITNAAVGGVKRFRVVELP